MFPLKNLLHTMVIFCKLGCMVNDYGLSTIILAHGDFNCHFTSSWLTWKLDVVVCGGNRHVRNLGSITGRICLKLLESM
jgi:hypothetical protein